MDREDAIEQAAQYVTAESIGALGATLRRGRWQRLGATIEHVTFAAAGGDEFAANAECEWPNVVAYTRAIDGITTLNDDGRCIRYEGRVLWNDRFDDEEYSDWLFTSHSLEEVAEELTAYIKRQWPKWARTERSGE